MVSCKIFSKITVKFFKTNMKVAASNLNTKPNQPRFFWHQKKQEGGGRLGLKGPPRNKVWTS